MIIRTKLLSLQPKYVQMYQSSTKTQNVRKAPDCKFEPECPPRKCVPPTTVCHTLPKQKCVITIKPPQTPGTEILPQPIPKTPPPKPPHGKMLPSENNMSPAAKMAYGFLKFNAKALIAGGSVYLTAKCGVWGSSEQTAELYKKSHDCVSSLIKTNAEKVADVPDSREVVAACKHYWNKGVILTVSSIVFLPATLKKWSKELYKQVSDSLSPGVSSKN